MSTYYYETPTGYGEFPAKSDEEAIKNMPHNTIILYKESGSTNGTPFITVYHSKKN